LPVMRQVSCNANGRVSCFSPMGLNAWWLPSLERVPVSPVPRLPQYYEGATTSRRACPSAYVFASGFHTPWCFVFACALPTAAKSVIGPGTLLRPVLRAGFPCGRQRDLSGSQAAPTSPPPTLNWCSECGNSSPDAEGGYSNQGTSCAPIDASEVATISCTR
jgi:hypothetical protein